MKTKNAKDKNNIQNVLQKIILIITNSRSEEKSDSDSSKKLDTSFGRSENDFSDFDDLSYDNEYGQLSFKANEKKSSIVEIYYSLQSFKTLIERWTIEYNDYERKKSSSNSLAFE